LTTAVEEKPSVDAHPWTISSRTLAEALRTDLEKGLSHAQAQERLARVGPNALAESKKISGLSIFLGQFKSLIVGVLVAAAGVAGFMQEWVDAYAILAIILMNAILGFVQEYRAEQSLAALKKLSSPSARVIRGGHKIAVNSLHIVPGDLVELEAGDHVPADGRVTWCVSFRTQEASLTGESTPVSKRAEPLAATDIALGDRTNMAYLGTSVVSGKARLAVTHTGMATELGKIAGLLQSAARESTPLKERLEALGRWLVWLCLGIVAVVFALGVSRGRPVFEMFLTAISLAVAAIPEGLPAVVTIALAIGVQRMVRRNALVRKLPAVETLGSTNVICSDKTGTLTQNEMTVRRIWCGGRTYEITGAGYDPKGQIRLGGASDDLSELPEDLKQTLRTGVLCNAASLSYEDDVWKVIGDPTEGALLSAAAKAGLSKEDLEGEERAVAEIPFDSERKRMTILRRAGRGYRAYVKGAPDVILRYCRFIWSAGHPKHLTEPDRAAFLAANRQLASEGLRVLAMAQRDFPTEPDAVDAEQIERDLVFVGLEAMQDPPRPEAREAVRRCREAGIRSVMITGDHLETARAIAEELGILDKGAEALTGLELDQMTEEALKRRIADISVFARVSAEHKLRVVRAWQARGAVVAMTGDGVNDAPALKEADIGVAMGITGTDVTKEASDMVILDDNFASIAAAVEEGRGIYQNIRKFVFFLLSCNTGEVLIMLFASLAGWPLPLLPVQILWLNLLTDGLPALALGVDPYAPDLMRRPVRSRKEEIVTKAFIADMLGAGSVIAACSLAAFAYVYYIERGGVAQARSLTFLVLACAQLAHAFNARSERLSLFSIGLFSNRWLVYAAFGSLALQLFISVWPPAQAIFETQTPQGMEWALAFGLSVLPMVVIEGAKAWRRKSSRASS